MMNMLMMREAKKNNLFKKELVVKNKALFLRKLRKNNFKRHILFYDRKG